MAKPWYESLRRRGEVSSVTPDFRPRPTVSRGGSPAQMIFTEGRRKTPNRAIQLRVSAQNSFYTSPGLSSSVPGDVCTISGNYLFDLGATGQSNTWAKYQAKTQADIEAQLRDNFLVDEPGVTTETRGTLILDFEGTASDDPAKTSHPTDLHTMSDANKAIVIGEWKKRQAATRAVFPYARISQYGVPIPQTRGDPANLTWIARIAALVQAGTVSGYDGAGGAWDALDAISPVLYNRYGPTDASINWNSYDDQANTCLIGAKTILKSTGATLPLLPLFATYVSNGGSNHHGELLFDLPTPDPLGSTWGQMFPKLREHGVSELVIWNGIDSIYARDGDGETTTPLADFIHAGRGWG